MNRIVYTEETTIVIRFKNLGADDSIREHQAVFEANGYVWGGWWAHSDELLPIREIAHLRSFALDKGLTIWLLNSETNVIYPVTVTDLRFSVDGNRIESPDKDRTPDYYKSHHLLLWFKIDAFEPQITHDSVINEYAYCDYATFKTSRTYDYSLFDNKIISKVEELSTQLRTIFFLRGNTSSDTFFDVSVYFLNTKQKNISHNYEQIKGNSLLLLSDLHFSEDNNRYVFSDFTSTTIHSTKTLLEAICEVCGEKDIASAIIPGDLTWAGTVKEYDYAEKFLLGLINHFQIDKKLMTIVPGNHDIMFNENEYKDGDDITIGFADEKSKRNYIHFYKKIYSTHPDEYLSIGRRLLLKNRLPVDIVGINSNCLQQNKNHFRGMGFVGRQQLNIIEDCMNWNEDSYSFKILVLHHHIHPVEYIEEPVADYNYSMSLDAGLLSSFISRNKINLVIHGHKHMEHFVQIGRSTHDNCLYQYYILGLGSASSSHLGQNTANSIATLDFNEHGNVIIRIHQVNAGNNENRRILLEHRIPINWGVKN